MIVRVHKRNGNTIVAMCDDDILGKVFEDGVRQLDLTSSFYAGEKISEEEAAQVARVANVINLVGQKSIEIGLSVGVISKKNIQTIQDIPYAQAVIEL